MSPARQAWLGGLFFTASLQTVAMIWAQVQVIRAIRQHDPSVSVRCLLTHRWAEARSKYRAFYPDGRRLRLYYGALLIGALFNLAMVIGLFSAP
jgi:hypothetical protein